MSRRLANEFGMVDISRSHLAPIDLHDVPDGFLPTQSAWLVVVGTTGTRSNRDSHVRRPTAKYLKKKNLSLSHWSDADLAKHDRHDKSRNRGGNLKRHDRRHGNVNTWNLSDVDDEGTTHEQPSELPVGAVGGDGVYYMGEQWDQYEESFERDEDDVQFNADEEVQSLIESEIRCSGFCLTSITER